ncbi:MAG: Crp/Fnr family transcriptional regulator [Lachnospiraceae bacterium]|nr:Crp/Fnr family transcriptional regulator [Lachnospiraceae bacterium]
MDTKNLMNTIFFQGLTEQELSASLTSLSALEKTYDKDTVIFHAGDLTDRMGLILSGSVTIESNDVWGNRTILSHVGKGEFFAETYALLPGKVMLVDVRTNEESQILFIKIGNIQDLSGSIPTWRAKIICNILTISAHKNLALSGRSFHTAPKSARGRIVAYLNSVSLQKHCREFDIPFDRQQLADYLNLERTNMSKELTKMKNDGLIEYHKNHFKLIR